MDHITSYEQLGAHWLKENTYYWEHYKDLKKPGTCKVDGFFDTAEAVKIIKDESGLSKVHVCGPGSRTTRDIDDERVRVYVDEDNKVTSQPTIG